MEVLTDYKFSRGTRGQTYNYDELFDGRQLRLVRGTDFTVLATSLRNHLSTKARERGKQLLTQIENDDTVVIQAVNKTNGGRPQRQRRTGRKPAVAAAAGAEDS